jgi:hypothetical protein
MPIPAAAARTCAFHPASESNKARRTNARTRDLPTMERKQKYAVPSIHTKAQTMGHATGWRGFAESAAIEGALVCGVATTVVVSCCGDAT